MKDPAFLFYDGDAARDVSHMNRLERGCYFDLIQAQRKYHGITVELARKILGNDFDTCWEAIEIVLIKDSDGKYYIEWVRESLLKSAQHSEMQRQRIQKYWDDKKNNEAKDAPSTKIPRNYRGNSVDIPLETETIKNKNKEGCGEKKEAEILYEAILQYFTDDLRPKNEKQKSEWIETLDKLIRIDGHAPDVIAKVIDKTRRDEFWRNNFLSVLKLRKKNREDISYFTVFKNRMNGTSTETIGGRIKRVNDLWNK